VSEVKEKGERLKNLFLFCFAVPQCHTDTKSSNSLALILINGPNGAVTKVRMTSGVIAFILTTFVSVALIQ
jgi:hypothetical protein